MTADIQLWRFLIFKVYKGQHLSQVRRPSLETLCLVIRKAPALDLWRPLTLKWVIYKNVIYVAQRAGARQALKTEFTFYSLAIMFKIKCCVCGGVLCQPLIAFSQQGLNRWCTSTEEAETRNLELSASQQYTAEIKQSVVNCSALQTFWIWCCLNQRRYSLIKQKARPMALAESSENVI